MESKKDYYSIQDLRNRWEKYPVSTGKNDLLYLGANGLIQYSILTKNLLRNRLFISVESSWHYVVGGKRIKCPHSLDISCANKYLKLTQQTIRNLLDDTFKNTLVDCHPWCEFCSENRFSGNCYVEYEIRTDENMVDEHLQQLNDEEIKKFGTELTCCLDDLVVTHDELIRFEKQFENILTPSYLNPESFGYCQELAVTVETWRKIFEFKRVNLETSCKMTAKYYIKKNYPDYGGNTNSGSGSLGRMVSMLNSPFDGSNKKEWNKFKKILVVN